jgi:nitrite reductase (NO-forming)
MRRFVTLIAVCTLLPAGFAILLPSLMAGAQGVAGRPGTVMLQHAARQEVGTATFAEAETGVIFASTAGTPVPAASPVASPADSPAAEMGDAGAAEPVTVASYDISFEPTDATIPANADVTFVLPNNGAVLHTFVIDELGVHSGDIPAGETVEIVVNAPAGTYEYYCDVPGHKVAGMVGTLIVE